MIENITDTATMQDELYKMLFENSIDAVLILEENNRILKSNPAAEELLGLAEEEIITLGCNGVIDGTDPNFRQLLDEIQNNGKARGQLIFIHKSGEKIPVEVSCKMFSMQNGDIRSCFVARDVREKKISKLLVQEASDFHKRILKSAPIGIVTYNSSGQCVSVNDSYAEIVGGTRAEILGQNFKEINSWRQFGLFNMALQALNEGMAVHKEIHMITTFGKEIWLDVTFTTFVTNNEVHLMLMVYDITLKKHTEYLLKRSEEKFRVSVESMVNSFIICQAVRDRVQTIMEFEIQYINRAGIELFQKLMGEISFNKFLRMFDGTDDNELFNTFANVVISGKAFHKILTIYNDEEKQDLTLALNLSVVKLGDGIAINIIDVTQDRIIHEKLLQINKTKDMFFSIIAHDLKSPFHTILGLTELLAEDPRQFSTEEQQELFQASNDHLKNTFKLIDNLLQWASNQNGQISFNPVKFNFKELLDETLPVYYNIAASKKIVIDSLDIHDHYVFADKNMIGTVVRNLISNAIKFSYQGAKIKLTSSRDRNKISVCISDQGIGMSKRELEKLFVPGEKIKKSGTNKESGTGLGLILCKDFIEKNNGSISVHSEPDKGSVFTFTLPSADQNL